MGLFRFRKGVSPAVLTVSGGSWEPDVHFTGDLTNKAEIAAIQAIIDKHARGIVAYYEFFPMAAMFSLEIQFSNEDKAEACRKDYDDLFTRAGKIKKKYLKKGK